MIEIMFKMITKEKYMEGSAYLKLKVNPSTTKPPSFKFD